jgi:hypothetical protein
MEKAAESEHFYKEKEAYSFDRMSALVKIVNEDLENGVGIPGFSSLMYEMVKSFGMLSKGMAMAFNGKNNTLKFRYYYQISDSERKRQALPRFKLQSIEYN